MIHELENILSAAGTRVLRIVLNYHCGVNTARVTTVTPVLLLVLYWYSFFRRAQIIVILK